MTINVEPTAQAIEQAAERMRQTGIELDRLAQKMRERNDIEYASEAFNSIVGVVQLCRVDLLVMRPMREFQSELKNAERAN